MSIDSDTTIILVAQQQEYRSFEVKKLKFSRKLWKKSLGKSIRALLLGRLQVKDNAFEY